MFSGGLSDMSEIYCGQATKYIVNLTDDERARLEAMLNKGTGPIRPITRALILLATDRNDTDEDIAYALHVHRSTVAAVRKRCVEEGLDAALFERVRPGAPRKLDGTQEAFVIALACTKAPTGYKRWTMQLLADKLVALGVVDEISNECVRETLKKTIPSRGSAKNGASPPLALNSSGGWKTFLTCTPSRPTPPAHASASTKCRSNS
jgi:transposase